MSDSPPRPAAHTGLTSPGQPADLPRTLGDLRRAGYRPRSVKQELRENALRRLAAGHDLFPGLVGYGDTVIPQIAMSLLIRHDLLLLGLRGQAKTRMLRAMIGLLDPWMPIIAAEGVELRDDPLHPLTRAGRQAVERSGDHTPIAWVHRTDRYSEKLATPDVTIADLIGEIDVVKYAAGRPLSDEGTMHFGLIPRANRGLFVINELPDLSPRIQVGLFNVLEERDVQIRGYPIRLDLDVCVMFSANPEDYTNRGRIVTPLKDRIGSVVRTHYPATTAEAMRITQENAFLARGSGPADRASDKDRPAENSPIPETRNPIPASPPACPAVTIPPILHEIIEHTIRLARTSPHINQASGVSVRASIAALENVVSSAELRGAVTGEPRVTARIVDLAGVLPAVRGKVELMLGDDAAGAEGKSTEDRLIEALLGEATKAVLGRSLSVSRLEDVAAAFTGGIRLELGDRISAKDCVESMRHIKGLLPAAESLAKTLSLGADDPQTLAACGEMVLEFLYVHNRLSKIKGGYAR